MKTNKNENIDRDRVFYENLRNVTVFKDAESNRRFLQDKLNYAQDIVYKQIYLGQYGIPVLIAYVTGMAERDIIDNQMLKPLMVEVNSLFYQNSLSIDIIRNNLLTTVDVYKANNFEQLIYPLLSGDTLLFLEGSEEALVIGSIGTEGRSIGKPDTEQTVRGSKEGFTEKMQTNLVMLRRRVKSPNLAIELLKIGRETKTELAIVYLKGIMNDGIIDEIIYRINQIDIDGVIGTSQIEELIQENKWTVMPMMLATERPDRVVGSLLDGRAAIILDGTPYVLIAPTTFAMFFITPDDYYGRPVVSSLLRMLRYFAFFVSTSLGALYVSLTEYNPGLLPTSLVISITGTRIGLPFNIAIELILMELTLYIIEEAAIRLPRPVGQTIGVFGGLVIGQAVVQAGLISPVIVVIVAMAGISSFVLPIFTFSLSITGVRVAFILFASMFGLYGTVMAWIFLIIHLASLESFGIRYLSEFSPYNLQNIKDSINRAPMSMQKNRPSFLKPKDTLRLGPDKVGDREDER